MICVFWFPYKLCYNQIRNFAPSFNGRMEISMKITNEKTTILWTGSFLKFIMAVLVAARHVIQIYYPAESKWRLVIGCWLSNLAVPIFFLIAGFLLFQKIPAQLPNDTNTTDTDIKKQLAHCQALYMPHPETVYPLVYDLLAY